MTSLPHKLSINDGAMNNSDLLVSFFWMIQVSKSALSTKSPLLSFIPDHLIFWITAMRFTRRCPEESSSLLLLKMSSTDKQRPTTCEILGLRPVLGWQHQGRHFNTSSSSDPYHSPYQSSLRSADLTQHSWPFSFIILWHSSSKIPLGKKNTLLDTFLFWSRHDSPFLLSPRHRGSETCMFHDEKLHQIKMNLCCISLVMN